MLLRESDQYEQAAQLCEQALLSWPNDAALWQQRCEIYEAQQKWAAALYGRQHLAKLSPSNYANLSEIADLYQRIGDYAQSVLVYQQAQALAPDHPVIANNLGNALQWVHRYDESLSQYQRAIQNHPEYFDAWHNCAVTLRRLERMADAQQASERSLAICPDHPKALWNLALLKLLLGNYSAGWPLYESRWKNAELGLHHPEFLEPSLLNCVEVRGKHVFIWAEQGLGDMLQMLRYVPVLIERGARVSVQVPQPLKRIAYTVASGVHVYDMDQRPTEFDLQCPYMSLPLASSTRLETIPCTFPYLSVPMSVQAKQEAKHLQVRSKSACLHVGLVWSGRSAHRNDHNRSIELQEFCSLFDIPDVQYWSLQKEYKEADRVILKLQSDRLIDCSSDLYDMADTAALIAQMDLVISVDTSVAHLAAAMGKPVWLLLPTDPDFRWLLDRDDSPWYPSMILFRQTSPGQWRNVIQTIQQHLEAQRLEHETYAYTE